MTLRSDIIAVRNNDLLSDDEKRAAIYALKAAAIESIFAPRVGQTITRGNFTLTLLKPVKVLANRTLEFWVRVTRNGLEVPLSLPILITNPPIMVPDATPGTFREDVLQAIRDVIMDVVR